MDTTPVDTVNMETISMETTPASTGPLPGTSVPQYSLPFPDDKEPAPSAELVPAVPMSLPKACPPEPMISAFTASDSLSVTYPEASSYEFSISKKKRVDRQLDVFYVGVRDLYQRQWSFVIPTPPCFVTFTAVYKGEAHNTRALLCPMYGDGLNAEQPAPMIAFLDHVNKISLALQEKMCTIDPEFSENWMSPLKHQNDFLMGMNVRIKSENVRACILNCPYNVRCVVKLTCVYSTKARCGLSFEVIEAFPQA